MIHIIESSEQLRINGHKIVSLLAWDREAGRAFSPNQKWSVCIIDANGNILLKVPEIPGSQLTFRRHPIVFDGMVSIEATSNGAPLTVCVVTEYHRNEKN